jgi:lipid II:glycine glycyltransferase (peptidoglycan interpeptide bridge formation enzyme)
MNPGMLTPLTLNDGDLFGAAVVSPAFGSDLSTWTLTIQEHGLLTQTISISQPPVFERQVAVLRQHVTKVQLDTLKQIVNEEKLLEFGLFPAICVTDQQQTQIEIRLSGRTTIIDAYAPHFVKFAGGTEMDRLMAKRYCKLWDAIEELAPFTPYRD